MDRWIFTQFHIFLGNRTSTEMLLHLSKIVTAGSNFLEIVLRFVHGRRYDFLVNYRKINDEFDTILSIRIERSM